jgi:hypothetical protein
MRSFSSSFAVHGLRCTRASFAPSAVRLCRGGTSMLARTFRFVVPAAAALALFLAVAPARSEGLLGVFFDDNGQDCAGDVRPGVFVTLYVVLQSGGSTYSGITGVEYRVDTGGATGYMIQGETPLSSDAVMIGSAFSGGVNIAFPSCQRGSAIGIASFQVLNVGNGGRDATFRVLSRSQPTNPAFACPLAVLCDEPVYSKVCVDAGFALLNPSGQRGCGGARIPSEWSRVKELYRP